jgi:hypothetical protein
VDGKRVQVPRIFVRDRLLAQDSTELRASVCKEAAVVRVPGIQYAKCIRDFECYQKLRARTDWGCQCYISLEEVPRRTCAYKRECGHA